MKFNSREGLKEYSVKISNGDEVILEKKISAYNINGLFETLLELHEDILNNDKVELAYEFI